jgi:RHS repeat-associated protein
VSCGAALPTRGGGAHGAFYTFDPQGSVSQRLDAAGAPLSSHLYAAHGSALAATAAGDPFGYGARWGYYSDPETGLLLLTHRYYDPSAGRFLTRDPAGYAGGVNLYAYVQNGPLSYSDPSGLDGWGNDLADWLDDRIGGAQRYLRPDVQDWVGNGAVATGADMARGFADMLRVGSGVGHALYDCDDNGYGRAAAVAQDIARAAAIFQTLAGPFAGRGGANCFVAGTPVQTAGGAKPIEEVRAGDVVASADPAQPDGPALRQEVARTFERTAAEVVDIRVGRETITATPEHPFWVVGAGWTEAGELRRGAAD